MTKRMLIDSTHAEETRVVVLDDSKLEDFDVETSTKKQLKGNIYLAKIVRVEPSLQAAFVEYGGGRHGFLAFGEIHPDYYQIPVADRQRLLAIQAEEARAAEAEEDAAALGKPPPARAAAAVAPLVLAEPQTESETPGQTDLPESDLPQSDMPDSDPPKADLPEAGLHLLSAQPAPMEREELFGPSGTTPEPDVPGDDTAAAEPVTETGEEPPESAVEGAGAAEMPPSPSDAEDAEVVETVEETPEAPETVGGDDSGGDGAEDARARRASRLLRSYRIQEVIHRRQIILVQVVKEERGTKGAALTTYISLAGRFSVLMPNSPRGGGISRKITSAADRKRLKEVTAELDLPQGMGLIVRTAGANRPKPEIRRDCEYLMRLWDDIREHTLRSIAPALIYEEASLIKRAIRDVYSRDIDEIVVDGEDGFRAAHEFMRMLMPSHARKVQMWRGADGQGSGAGGQPLFAKYQVEAQLDAMLSPTVQLKSGGYLVIDQTEALVAIDVNSGRSTRERNIEETALRTNLEAADEAARQLRLRDLAGLIVIDFIDMESRRHNAAVEKRLKDGLKVDRARLQVGQISHFGLLEMSRQRLRPSLAETSFDPCPHCGGTGHVRNIDSSAISVLRAIEDEGAKAKASVIMVHATGAVVMYLLNHKRDRVGEIESRFGMRVQFASDDALTPGQVRIDRVRPMGDLPPPRPAALIPVVPAAPAYPASDGAEDEIVDDEDDLDVDDEERPAAGASAGGRAERPAAPTAMTAEEGERRRKRRRRRRGGRREGGAAEADAEAGDADDRAEAPGAEASGADEAGATPAAAGPAAYGLAPEQPPETADERAPAAMPAMAEPADAIAAASPGGSGDQPGLEAADLDEDGLPRARRRGRRGGRRRRRDGDDEAAQSATAGPAAADLPPQPYVPVPYLGPTPANPFGGDAFDIFDMIDTAGEDPEPRSAAPRPVSPAPQPPPALVSEPEPENVAAEFSPPEPQPEPGPEPEGEPEPRPIPLPELAAAEAESPPHHARPAEDAAPAAEMNGASADHQRPDAPEVGPRIQPVVIGEGDQATERKRGWWRR